MRQHYKLGSKTILITGAGSGIGRSLAEHCSARGAYIIATDLNHANLDSLQQHARKFSREIHCHTLDVCDEAAQRNLATTLLKQHQRIDIWINNAGIHGTGALREMESNAFQKVMDINFGGVVHGTRTAIDIMLDQGSGLIVNIASVAGHVPSPYMSAYCASKHAVVGFTRSIQAELAFEDSPIKMLLVSPGFVDTQLINKGQDMGFPQWLSWMLAKPEAIAKSIIKGIEQGAQEITPTWNGKMMLRMHSVAPRLTVKSSKLLLTRSFKDLLLNRYSR